MLAALGYYPVVAAASILHAFREGCQVLDAKYVLISLPCIEPTLEELRYRQSPLFSLNIDPELSGYEPGHLPVSCVAREISKDV